MLYEFSVSKPPSCLFDKFQLFNAEQTISRTKKGRKKLGEKTAIICLTNKGIYAVEVLSTAWEESMSSSLESPHL